MEIPEIEQLAEMLNLPPSVKIDGLMLVAILIPSDREHGQGEEVPRIDTVTIGWMSDGNHMTTEQKYVALNLAEIDSRRALKRERGAEYN